ncbi:MAG: enoyl-CoA hydratase-related protein [Vicinamibacterales bacterium]
MSDFSTIHVLRLANVDYVTLNRPEVRNAFNEQLIAEMTEWAQRAADDASLRGVVISGAGASFCAGADVAWMAKMAGYSQEENLRDARAAAAMFSVIDTLSVPVIAQIHGAALGGGAGIAAVADIAVAADDTTFGFTEVKLGLIPAVIAPYVLAKIGQSAARELFITGRRFDAAHARDIGLVHAVVPAADLIDRVNTYLIEIAANGPEAMSAAKALLRRIANQPIADTVPITAKAIAERRVSDEAQKMMKTFLKK